MPNRFRHTWLAVLVILAGGVPAPLHAQGVPELVSLTPSGTSSTGLTPLEIYGPGQTNISADRRFVVFSSTAPDLVPGDTNGTQDVFLRDRITGVTTLISRASGVAGALGNAPSGQPVISADGRFVAYVSRASNLVPGDTNQKIDPGTGLPTATGHDIFVRDLAAATTTRVSVSTSGAEAVDGVGAERPAISRDGRYIAFSSPSSNLAPGGFDLFNQDIYLRDTVAGTTTLVSVLPGGGEIVGADAVSPSISADGTRVAFVLYDNTLLGPTPQVPPNLSRGVYVRDLPTAQTVLVSARPDGTPDRLLSPDFAMISADGRYVSFASWDDLDPAAPDTAQEAPLDGPFADIFVRDLATATTRRASMPFPGGPAEESGRVSSISSDGRFVGYFNGTDMVVRDMLASTSVVLRPNGLSPNVAFFTLSADARLAYFETFDDLLTSDANGNLDAYVMPVPGAAGADLSLALTASTTQPAQGSAVTLTVAVTNAGGQDASGVTVALTLPAGLTYVSDDGGGSYGGGVWTPGAITVGSTASLHVVVTASGLAPLPVMAEITTATPFDPDSTPGNGIATEDDQQTLTLTPPAIDLALSLNANTLAPPLNSNVTLTLSVANSGTVAATGVTAGVALPAGLTFVSSAGGGSYDPITGVFTVGTLAAGATRTRQVVARVTTVAPIDVMAEVLSAVETDRDSTPGNGLAGEDDQATLRLVAVNAGIVVNDAAMTVNANDGRCTLVEAIIAANTDLPSGNAIGECAGGNGADIIHLRALTPPYTVSTVHNNTLGFNGLPVITSDITIDAAGQVIERAAGAATPRFRLFYVAASGRLVLDHAVVSRGDPWDSSPAVSEALDGGGIFNDGTLVLVGGRIAFNRAACYGGGLVTRGHLTATAGVAVENNVAGCNGGGIAAYGAAPSVSLAGVTIGSNAAVNLGGGLYIGGSATATVDNSTISANSASDGGGAYVRETTSLTVTSSTIQGNVVTAGGGGISVGQLATNGFVFPGGTLVLSNSVVSNNTAGLVGGGIAGAGPIIVTSGQISGNRVNSPAAYCGGGIYAVESLTLRGVSINSNTALFGGGVCARGPSTSLIGGEVRLNSALRSGGGVIAFRDLATVYARRVDVTGTVVANNTAQDDGGGVFFQALSSVATVDSLTLDGAVIQQNVARGRNGGGLLLDHGVVDIRGATRITGNAADNAGGGIFVSGGIFPCCDGDITMTGGSVTGNTANGIATGGGGIAMFATVASRRLLLTGVDITGNTTPTGSGGGVLNLGVLVANGANISGNTAAQGGGIANGTPTLDGGSALLTDTTVANNTASGPGGGLYAVRPIGAAAVGASIVRGAVRGNLGSDGGGIFMRGNADLTIDGTVIDGNTSSGIGGGVNSSAPMRLRGVTLSGNTARVAAGGAELFSGGSVVASTVSGNRAPAAAAIRVNGVFDVTTSTISGNVAGNAGAGALDVVRAAGGPRTRVTVTSSTIVDNVGLPGGVSNGGDVQLVQSILAGNRQPDGTPSECRFAAGAPATPVFVWDANVVGRDTACAVSTTTRGNQRLVDPAEVFTTLLGPLANNGGLTFTHAPLPGSLAIDAVLDPPAFACPADQRGAAGPIDGDGDGVVRCDAGAVEAQAVGAVPVPVAVSLTPPTATGALPAEIRLIGTGFTAGSVGLWNGAPRVSFAESATTLRISLLPSDAVTGVDIATALVGARSAQGTTSNAVPFTMLSANVSSAQSRLAAPGATVTASAAGVSATLTHNGASTPGPVLTVASYAANPTPGTLFAAGGYFDVQVVGADAVDVLDARFYYPATVTGGVEAGLQLLYWTGTAWAPVLGSGGVTPVKDTTDNLDGVPSGGRISVRFDVGSTPAISALTGTVFAMAETGTSPVRAWIVGAGVNYPERRGRPAFFAVSASGVTTRPLGVTYLYDAAGIAFASDTVTRFAVNGRAVTIEGVGKVNARTSVSYTATASAATPNTFALTLRRADGSVLFSAPAAPLAGGAFALLTGRAP